MNIPNAIKPLLKQYSQGSITAENAAWEIQKLHLEGMNCPSVSEVIVWSKLAGYGIPNPPDEEVEAQIKKALSFGHFQNSHRN